MGYKEFGFGETYDKKNIKNISDKWISLVKEFSKKYISKKYINEYYEDENLKVGIDSVIVKKWRDELIKQGVDERMLVGEEGKFSCFVDTVNLKIASSSFTEKQEDLDLNKNDILEEFGKF